MFENCKHRRPTGLIMFFFSPGGTWSQFMAGVLMEWSLDLVTYLDFMLYFPYGWVLPPPETSTTMYTKHKQGHHQNVLYPIRTSAMTPEPDYRLSLASYNYTLLTADWLGTCHQNLIWRFLPILHSLPPEQSQSLEPQVSPHPSHLIRHPRLGDINPLGGAGHSLFAPSLINKFDTNFRCLFR